MSGVKVAARYQIVFLISFVLRRIQTDWCLNIKVVQKMATRYLWFEIIKVVSTVIHGSTIDASQFHHTYIITDALSFILYFIGCLFWYVRAQCMQSLAVLLLAVKKPGRKDRGREGVGFRWLVQWGRIGNMLVSTLLLMQTVLNNVF